MDGGIIQRLAGYLSDCQTYSVEAIASELGCDESQVVGYLEALRDLDVELDVISGEGYRLRNSLELLERDSILNLMDDRVRNMIRNLVIESSVDSTNSALKRLSEEQQHGSVILAEHQHAGRGRRGRQWFSPYARNLYLSLGWQFSRGPSQLGCLSLVVALAVATALARAGLAGHQVKWPNDLLIDGRKVSGCLVEMQGSSKGPCSAVVGVGINVDMPQATTALEIGQPWTDLNAHLQACSRNRIATLVLEELALQMSLYDERGFDPFKKSWDAFDGLAGTVVTVMLGNRALHGQVIGIDLHGALLLDTGRELMTLHAGEVSFSKGQGGV